jgi:hypothetical protein
MPDGQARLRSAACAAVRALILCLGLSSLLTESAPPEDRPVANDLVVASAGASRAGSCRQDCAELPPVLADQARRHPVEGCGKSAQTQIWPRGPRVSPSSNRHQLAAFEAEYGFMSQQRSLSQAPGEAGV